MGSTRSALLRNSSQKPETKQQLVMASKSQCRVQHPNNTVTTSGNKRERATIYLPKLAISIRRLVRAENLASQEHEEEVVRRGRRTAPRRLLLQVRAHRRQARRQQLVRLVCHELIG